jgi:hypothetical protein
VPAPNRQGLLIGRPPVRDYLVLGTCSAFADRGPGASDGEAKVSLAGLGQRYDLTTLNDYLARPTASMPPVDDAGSRVALAEFLLDRFR